MKYKIIFIFALTILLACSSSKNEEVEKTNTTLDTLINFKYKELTTQFRFKLLEKQKASPYLDLSKIKNEFEELKKTINENNSDVIQKNLKEIKQMLDTMFSSTTAFNNEISTAKILLSVFKLLPHNQPTVT